MRSSLCTQPRGYTLVELIVALLLFAIGGLALAGTSAVIGRSLNIDVQRERAARLASRQIEILSAACHEAVNGSRIAPPLNSEWTVSRPDPGHIDVSESVSYPTSNGRRTDSYRTLAVCP
jgi:prepilin-type N-terminal cleavage/methylation domain-containing protein